MNHTSKLDRYRSGFSAIEVVICILMAGLLATVATPRVLHKIEDTRRVATMESLGKIRDAIHRYQDESDDYWCPDDLVACLADNFTDGEFPVAAVSSSSSSSSNSVTYIASDPIGAGDVTADGGWLYNAGTGEIRVNDVNFISW